MIMNLSILLIGELISNCENYEIIKPLGRGKYSEVFEGMNSE